MVLYYVFVQRQRLGSFKAKTNSRSKLRKIQFSALRHTNNTRATSTVVHGEETYNMQTNSLSRLAALPEWLAHEPLYLLSQLIWIIEMD